MSSESISLNLKFKELLKKVQENPISRKKFIELAEKNLLLTNEQATGFIARNIHVLTKENLIIATGESPHRAYLITDTLLTSINAVIESKKTEVSLCKNSISKDLRNQELKTNSELKLILGEIETYQGYLQKYPQNHNEILPLLESSRDSAADLYGRLNAINKIIKATEAKESMTC